MSKTNEIIKGASALSLGISIVIAVLIGVGLGILVKKYTNSMILFWICVAFGVFAAIMNVYKVYKDDLKMFDDMENFDENRQDE